MGGQMQFNFERDITFHATSSALFNDGTQQARLSNFIEDLRMRGRGEEITPVVAQEEEQNIEFEKVQGRTGQITLNSKNEICTIMDGLAVPVTDINQQKIKGYTKQECVSDYIKLKNAVDDLLDMERKTDDDTQIAQPMQQLNEAYDTFVRKYGNLFKNTSLAWLRNNDVDFPSIVALENPILQVTEGNKKIYNITKTDIFTKRVIGLQTENKPQTIEDALIASIQQTSKISIPLIQSWLGGTEEHLNVGSLKPNETKTLEYELMANQRAADQIDIQVELSERSGKYAKNADIPLQFGQYIGSSIAMNIERNDAEVEIRKATLISDVDENIPTTNTKNPNTFVLIIANEHYSQVASVPFALNDGNIFREYCIKTLGIGEKHIKYLSDATGNQIKSGVNWLANLTEAFDEPQIIVYYAGHGIPDEANKSAYLLPVDGSGTDVSTGYKLDNLYTTLGKMPASQITVFMDACFSGSKREDGMIASARGVALRVKSGVPQGNMVVFSAAQGDETAYPNREQQHGLFTYYLLKKLQETQGDIALKDLGDYITKQVSQQSLLLNSKKQTPCVTPSVTLGDQWQTWKLK